MTKQREPQTVAAATAILRDLEAKRDECLQHGQELTNVRRAHGYQAHAVHDPAQTFFNIIDPKRTWADRVCCDARTVLPRRTS